VRALALVAALVAVVAPAASAQTAERPSVVLVLTDDQRWDTLSAMPNVRRELVGRGVTFSNGFVVNSLCCPSRASILTGLYSHSTGVYLNTGRYGGFAAFRDASTVATWLQAVGYRTGYVGKYLNGYSPLSGYVPPGWSHWTAFAGRYDEYWLNRNGAPTWHGREPSEYSTDVLADDAVRFLRETAGPLFLVYAPYAPHSPATPAQRHAGALTDLEPWRPASYNEADVSDKPAWLRARPLLEPAQQNAIDEFRRDQLRSLLAVDEGVGRIVEALRETGRLENTLIAYTSDNGFAWGEHRRTSKMDPYEESIRVPFVVRYDALVRSPRRDRRLVLNIDLAPTFADVAGIVPPYVEGASLVPLLTSPDVPWRADFLVEHLRSTPTNQGIPSYCAVRNARSIFVSYETGEEELYDLVADPHQLQNLAASPERAAHLRGRRARLRQLCNPPPPVACTIFGTKGDDVLRGTADYDVVCAREGWDEIHAGPANDVVIAGSGGDRVWGGDGNDSLSGGSGNDVLRGRAGTDRLFGEGGSDSIAARDAARDDVVCGPGRDIVLADRVDRLARDCEMIRRADEPVTRPPDRRTPAARQTPSSSP
jgi:N-acetylglucosamine-6-sulfatase